MKKRTEPLTAKEIIAIRDRYFESLTNAIMEDYEKHQKENTNANASTKKSQREIPQENNASLD